MKVIAALFLLFFSAAASADELPVRIEGEDGFALKGTYFSAERPGPALLLLHQCNRDRSAYVELARSLAGAGFHVLTLDFRGFGESVGPSATDFHAESEELWPKFAGDVEAAYRFLLSQEGVDGARVGLLGASCGGSQALLAANRHVEVKTVVFLSSSVPWVGEDEIRSFEKKRAIPILCIAALEDRGTYQRMKRLFEHSSNAETRLMLYKGNDHGVPLFDLDPTLIGAISDWFAHQLR